MSPARIWLRVFFVGFAVIVAMLLLLQFLNNPFHSGIGGLKPIAMERSLKIIDQELQIANRHEALPCDLRGNAL